MTANPTRVLWNVIGSPAGKLVVGVTESGAVCRLAFLRQSESLDIVAAWQQSWPDTRFDRDKSITQTARCPVLLIGTPFQRSVWQAMTAIPRGQTASYGDLARAIGKPRAARAVGAACGANPVPYLVPCHRVIASDGSLGGFSSGLDIKEKLLAAEGVILPAADRLSPATPRASKSKRSADKKDGGGNRPRRR